MLLRRQFFGGTLARKKGHKKLIKKKNKTKDRRNVRKTKGESFVIKWKGVRVQMRSNRCNKQLYTKITFKIQFTKTTIIIIIVIAIIITIVSKQFICKVADPAVGLFFKSH